MTRIAGQQDANLLASAVAGDEIAFRRIIAAHHEDMRRVAAYVAGDHSIAEEAKGDPGAVRAGTARLVNEGGSWSITFTGPTPPGAPSSLSARHCQMLFFGEGGYEGLSAIIVVSPDGTAVWTFEGVIFPGPMPEFPPPMPPAE